jgi:hypothetical protein
MASWQHDGMGLPGTPGRLFLAIGAAAVAVVVVVVVLLAGGSGGTAGRPGASRGWVAAWGASPVVGATIAGLTCPAGAGLVNQTVRDVIFLSADGDEVRVRLSNTFSRRAIAISHATVASAKSGQVATRPRAR